MDDALPGGSQIAWVAAPLPYLLDCQYRWWDSNPQAAQCFYRAAATRVQAGRVYQFHHSGKWARRGGHAVCLARTAWPPWV
jgi:hypothetical protein